MNAASQKLTFAIYVKGDELEPDDVTAALGVAPTKFHRKGDRTRTPTNIEIVRNTSVWALVVKSDDSDASALLGKLLAQVEVGATVKAIAGVESAYVDLFFAVSAGEDGGGTCEFGLDEKAIAAVKSIGLPVNFTIAVVKE